MTSEQANNNHPPTIILKTLQTNPSLQQQQQWPSKILIDLDIQNAGGDTSTQQKQQRYIYQISNNPAEFRLNNTFNIGQIFSWQQYSKYPIVLNAANNNIDSNTSVSQPTTPGANTSDDSHKSQQQYVFTNSWFGVLCKKYPVLLLETTQSVYMLSLPTSSSTTTTTPLTHHPGIGQKTSTTDVLALIEMSHLLRMNPFEVLESLDIDINAYFQHVDTFSNNGMNMNNDDILEFQQQLIEAFYGPHHDNNNNTTNNNNTASPPQQHNTGSAEDESDIGITNTTINNTIPKKSDFQQTVKMTDLIAQWSKSDEYFNDIVNGNRQDTDGLRVLDQKRQISECIWAFICSQNNNTTRIAQNVNKICQLYGEKMCILQFEPPEKSSQQEQQQKFDGTDEQQSSLTTTTTTSTKSTRSSTRQKKSQQQQQSTSSIDNTNNIIAEQFHIHSFPYLAKLNGPPNDSNNNNTTNDDTTNTEEHDDLETILRNNAYGYRAAYFSVFLSHFDSLKQTGIIIDNVRYKLLGDTYEEQCDYLYKISNFGENISTTNDNTNDKRDYKKIARTILCSFKGIGDKVASCISLFALDQQDNIPMDVHVHRLMLKHYAKRAYLWAFDKLLWHTINTIKLHRSKLFPSLLSIGTADITSGANNKVLLLSNQDELLLDKVIKQIMSGEVLDMSSYITGNTADINQDTNNNKTTKTTTKGGGRKRKQISADGENDNYLQNNNNNTNIVDFHDDILLLKSINNCESSAATMSSSSSLQSDVVDHVNKKHKSSLNNNGVSLLVTTTTTNTTTTTMQDHKVGDDNDLVQIEPLSDVSSSSIISSITSPLIKTTTTPLLSNLTIINNHNQHQQQDSQYLTVDLVVNSKDNNNTNNNNTSDDNDDDETTTTKATTPSATTSYQYIVHALPSCPINNTCSLFFPQQQQQQQNQQQQRQLSSGNAVLPIKYDDTMQSAQILMSLYLKVYNKEINPFHKQMLISTKQHIKQLLLSDRAYTGDSTSNGNNTIYNNLNHYKTILKDILQNVYYSPISPSSTTTTATATKSGILLSTGTSQSFYQTQIVYNKDDKSAPGPNPSLAHSFEVFFNDILSPCSGWSHSVLFAVLIKQPKDTTK